MDTETEYYVRIILLLFKGGTLICKGIVDRELKHVDLDQILKTREPLLKRKLLKSQYFMLFPRHGIPNPNDFDLSLLTVVLLDVLSLPRDERLEVENIKQIRNKLIHGQKVSLDQGTYANMKQILQEALAKLAGALGVDVQQEYGDMIGTFLTAPLDQRTAIDYVHGIRNDEELLQRVHEMLEEQRTAVSNMIKESENRLTTKFDTRFDEHEKVLDGIIRTMKGCHEDKDRSSSTEEDEIKDPPLCEICFEQYLSSTAIYFCNTCNQFLCVDCNYSQHTKSLLLSMKNHHIQNAKGSGNAKVDMKGMDVCTAHSGDCIFFCKQHEALCCDRCAREHHENCQEVVEIDKIAQSSANNMLDPVAAIGRLNESTTSMDYWMESFQEKLDKRVANIPVRLQEKRKKMIDLFDKKASLVTNEVRELKEERSSQIQENRKLCRYLIKSTEQTKRSLIRIATTGTSVQRFIANQHISSQIKILEDECLSIKSSYETSSDFPDFQIFKEMAQELDPLSLNVPNVDC